jgi:hypothetical protein
MTIVLDCNIWVSLTINSQIVGATIMSAKIGQVHFSTTISNTNLNCSCGPPWTFQLLLLIRRKLQAHRIPYLYANACAA